MKLTRIEITVAETVNLGDYSNSRPSITLEAALEPGDEPKEVLYRLIGMGDAALHEQVDAALMDAGKSPKYATSDLFVVLANSQLNLIVVAPKGWGKKSAWWHHVTPALPYLRAVKHAERELKERSLDSEKVIAAWEMRVVETDAEIASIEPLIAEREALRAAEEERQRQERERQRLEQEAERQRQAEERQRSLDKLTPYTAADSDDDEEDDDDDNDE